MLTLLRQVVRFDANASESIVLYVRASFLFLLYKKPRFSQDDFYAAQNATHQPCSDLSRYAASLATNGSEKLIQFDLN